MFTQFNILLLIGVRQIDKTIVLKYLSGQQDNMYVTLGYLIIRDLALTGLSIFL